MRFIWRELFMVDHIDDAYEDEDGDILTIHRTQLFRFTGLEIGNLRIGVETLLLDDL